MVLVVDIMEFIKKEFVIRLFIFIVLLSLNIAVINNGRSLDCNKCILNFESYKRGSDTASNLLKYNFSMKVVDLHEGLLNGECRIIFDEEGFRVK